MSVYGERIMRLETQLKNLDEKFEETQVRVDAQFAEVKNQTSEINTKVDELLELKNRGAGIFAVVSVLVGTGFMGLIYNLVQWFRG